MSEAAGAIESADPSGSARRWAGPRVLAAGFVSYLVSTGLNVSILGVFIRPAAEAFSASMATMGAVPSFYHLISAAIGPWLGQRYARGAIRPFMLLGACLLPIGLFGVSRSDSLAAATFWYGAATVIGAFMLGPLASNTLVTNWYGPSRGRALGLITTGSTTAGVLLPTLAAVLIEAIGWRDALALLGFASLFITLPMFAWGAIDRPEAIGQIPERYPEDAGAASPPTTTTTKATAAAAAAEPESAPISTGEILRQLHFWAIAGGFGLLFALSLISITFTVAYAEQLGLSLRGGATVLAARSASAILGQLSLGWLSDRVGQRPVLWGAIAFEALCWIAFVQAPDALVFTLAGLGIGFVSGSFAPLRGALVAQVYGRRDFAKVSGLLSPAALPFQILAVPLAGYLYDRTGDYADAFSPFFLVFPVAALLVACVPTRRPEPIRTAA